MTPRPSLVSALHILRDRISEIPRGLELPDAEAERRAAEGVVAQIDDYLLPRVQRLDAPLLAVVGGSTGAGKSTLVNSLVGVEVSPASVIRPTTRMPVLVCAERDRDWFIGERVLPGLTRILSVHAAADGARGLRVVTVPDLPAGVALVDAPDIDSVVDSNRELAGQLLAAADLWVFVTTAERYADAVPWQLLREARQRNTALAVVLNRTPPEAADEVAGDLRAMLAGFGLNDARLYVVEEVVLESGRLPAAQIGALREWLRAVAVDGEARNAVMRQTLIGALDSLDARVASVAAALEQQQLAAQDLRLAASSTYDAAFNGFAEAVRSGTLLRGEVLARWQDFVGASDWMRSVQSRVGSIRDRITGSLTGRPTSVERLHEALESSVEMLLRTAADSAAERTVLAWRASPGGAALLRDHDRELDRASAEFATNAANEVRDWQGYVLELVRGEGAGRRATARFLSLGVNGAGLAVMIVVFAHTGGLTGGEVVVAGGTSAVAQKLLEAVFGDAAIRALASRARDDLERRARGLLDAERKRFEALLEGVAASHGDAEALHEARRVLVSARRPEALE